jgi:transcriptional regulator with XRE-family HTH domain
MNRLREIRLGKNLNQRELSEASHTPQAIVSALERGVLKPWPKVAKRLSQALAVPAETLFPEDKESIATREEVVSC